MHPLTMGPTGLRIFSREGHSDSLMDRMTQHPCRPSIMPREGGKQTARSEESSSEMQQFPARPHPFRVAIKVRDKILFIDLGNVVSVQANGKCVWLLQKRSSYLLRESISAVAERLETHGFIRIHRSVLVNASFVEEIRPLPTGEYRLRLEGGKEYTVTRTYKKNLKSLAECWIGTGGFFSG